MEANQRLEALLASAPIVHFVFDRAGVVTLHEGSYGALGDRGVALGRSVLSDFAELPWLQPQARRALAGEMFADTVPVGDAWLALRYIPLRGGDGAVSEVVVFGVDVTARQRRAQELVDSEERYRRLAEATFEAIAIHDGRRVLDANARMSEMFGYSLEELSRLGPLELAAPASRALVASRIAAGSEEAYEALGQRKDGSTFVGELRSKQMTYQGRPVRITAIRDVTARRRAEQQRDEHLARAEAARATAEAALGIRDEFMSIAAHELNSPLTTLKVRVEQLAAMVRQPGIDGARAGELLDVCVRQVNRLARLVRELLDVTRIRSGSSPSSARRSTWWSWCTRWWRGSATSCSARARRWRCARRRRWWASGTAGGSIRWCSTS